MINLLNKIIIFIVTAFIFISCKKDNVPASEESAMQYIKTVDICKSDLMPPFGKWMYTTDNKYAEWLGTKLDGKTIREPINVIIIDSVTGDADKSKNNLIEAFKEAGFSIRFGHSGGYRGFLGNELYPQIPDKSGYAFSDEPFELNNSHGRFFGPFIFNNVCYYTGAMSNEKVKFSLPIHHYGSFNIARDKLGESLNLKTSYKTYTLYNMDNILNTDSITTGDHDGKALIISLIK